MYLNTVVNVTILLVVSCRPFLKKYFILYTAIVKHIVLINVSALYKSQVLGLLLNVCTSDFKVHDLWSLSWYPHPLSPSERMPTAFTFLPLALHDLQFYVYNTVIHNRLMCLIMFMIKYLSLPCFDQCQLFIVPAKRWPNNIQYLCLWLHALWLAVPCVWS